MTIVSVNLISISFLLLDVFSTVSLSLLPSQHKPPVSWESLINSIEIEFFEAKVKVASP